LSPPRSASWVRKRVLFWAAALCRRPREQATRPARGLQTCLGFPMKIAQIAPLAESVPPKLYGGTERVVSYLTEELVRLGHDVTLFASGDSETSAKLVACVSRALRLDPKVCDVIPYYMLMLDRVRRQSHQFDILHFHIDYLHFPLFRDMSSRVLTTLHGRQDLPDN